MFYSHTFLARKGPLGTVWCAAHLQHRLRKSQYISTNIPSTVEKIIDPQVPIALRMSAHLLLGVVRVYSKQVDYFQEDCNGVVITLNRVYSAVSVNLPDDFNHAPVHSITLPQKFSLDAMDLDDYFKDGFEDPHVNSLEDITLTEQIPTEDNPFIAITFEEHELRSSSFTEDVSGTGPVPMLEDVIPSVQTDTDASFRDLSERNEDNADARTVGESSPQNPPSLEIMRDAGHGFHFNGSPILPNRADPDVFLEELMRNHDKETRTVVRDEVELPDAPFSSPPRHQEQNSHVLRDAVELPYAPLSSPPRHQEQNTPGNINSSIFSEHQTPQLEIRESPVIAVVAEPKVRKRKRKQFFDTTTVLSNDFMKKALDDTHDLYRRKRNCPSTSLDVWKQSKRLKKDSIFDGLNLIGSCGELQQLDKEDAISSNPHLVASTSENAQVTNSAQHNASRVNDNDEETEVLRNTGQGSNNGGTEVLRNTGQDDSNVETEVLRNTEQASQGGYMPPEFTPENFSSWVQSERFDTTSGAEIPHTATAGDSTGNLDSEMQTPSTYHFEHRSLFNIPEESTAGDLDFLEQDDHSLAEFQVTSEFGSGSVNQSTPRLQLTSRTRAVAQFLKNQSPITPIPESVEDPESAEEAPADLNLNKVVEGKSRKISARMFYETLVLKHLDLVDMQQEKPYGDITLKITPKLSKGEFLG